MKITIVTFAMLAAVALAPAQDAPPKLATYAVEAPANPFQAFVSRLGGTYSFDLAKNKKGEMRIKSTPILTYRVSTYENVLPDLLKGRMKTNLDLSGLMDAKGDGAAMGFGLLSNSTIHLRATRDTSIDVTGTLGLSFLYGTDGGKTRVGLVLGVGFKF